MLGLGPQSQLLTHTVLLSLRVAILLSALPRQRSWRGCAQCRCLRWVSRSRTRESLPAQAPDTARQTEASAAHPWAGAKRSLNPVARGSSKGLDKVKPDPPPKPPKPRAPLLPGPGLECLPTSPSPDQGNRGMKRGEEHLQLLPPPPSCRSLSFSLPHHPLPTPLLDLTKHCPKAGFLFRSPHVN